MKRICEYVANCKENAVDKKRQVIQAVTLNNTLFRGDDLPLKGSLDHPRKVTKNFSGAGVLLKAAHPDRAKKKQRHTEKICMNITSSFLGLI